jgi:hypothetical protein
VSLAVLTLAAGARDRYLIPAVPFFAIVAAHHIDIERRVPRAAGIVILALLGLASAGMGVFLLQKGILLQALLLIATGLAAALIARRRLRWLECGLLAGVVFLLVQTHGLTYYRSTYLAPVRPLAETVERALDRDLPVVVDPDVDLIHLAVELEGLRRQPVYDRNVHHFPEYYLITSVARRDPGGRELLRAPYTRRKVGEIVVQEIGGS